MYNNFGQLPRAVQVKSYNVRSNS